MKMKPSHAQQDQDRELNHKISIAGGYLLMVLVIASKTMLGLIGSREAVVHWCSSYVINLHIWNAKGAIDSRQACGIARKSGTTMTKVTRSADPGTRIRFAASGWSTK
jgi:hypothetical protein